MNNINKGKKYELYVQNHIGSKYTDTYLWNQIPINIFNQTNIYKNYYEKRKNIKSTNTFIDTGCDILYKKNNDWIIVQCKNYTDTICMNNLAGFYHLCGISNYKGEVYHTSKISHIIDIKNDKYQYIHFPFDIIPNKSINNFIPYDYQLSAVNKLKLKKRSIIQLPCGMGKTFTSILWAKQFDCIIIFSPLRVYAEQNLNQFSDYYQDYKSILIDSDGNRDIENIKEFLKINKNFIISSTYKSSDIVCQLIKYIHGNVGVIIDEFHNLTRDNVLNETNDFYKILINDNLNFLFLSATPRVYEIEETEENLINITGYIEFKYEFGDAITNKYINDYAIYIPDIHLKTKDNLKDIYNEINLSETNFDLDIKSHFLLRSLDETGCCKCICYMANIEEANNFAKSLNNMNKYHAHDLYVDTIVSDTSMKNRKKILNTFTNHIGLAIICSVHILDECIDIPPCDSVFMNKQSSKIRMIQ